MRQFLRRLSLWNQRRTFTNSRAYWNQRYITGGASTKWEVYGETAKFKADTVNTLVALYEIKSVIEFGCGDGRQLALAKYPSYLGVDVSEAAVNLCRAAFAGDKSKRFLCLSELQPTAAELALSQDVIYHAVEDRAYRDHLGQLFESATRFVVIYSNDTDTNPIDTPPHIRNRKFTQDVAERFQNWKLLKQIPHPNPRKSRAFFIYQAQ